MFVFAACILCLQPCHTVRLTPEVTTVTQGEPLLVRADVRFGIRRPSNYACYGSGLSPSTRTLAVSIRKRGEAAYRVIRTSNYGFFLEVCFHILTDKFRPMPPGRNDAAFVWVVADATGRPLPDGPGEFRHPAPTKHFEPRPEGIFDAAGEYQIRARILLKDDLDNMSSKRWYEVYSPPVTIRVVAATPEFQAKSDAVRPILYRAFPEAKLAPAEAAALRAALPALGDSMTASAARRLLALHDLKQSRPGDSRRKALAECEKLRATLSPVGRDGFALDHLKVLIDVREFDWALAVWKAAPEGPRRLTLGLELGAEMNRK